MKPQNAPTPSLPSPIRTRQSLRSLLVALALLLAAFSGRAAVIDGLVSYWPLDADAGGSTPDLSFDNTMTIVGSPAVSPGQFGNAFTFTGPATYLTNLHEPDNGATGLPIYRAGAYTVAMWVKGTNQTAKYLFAEGGLESNTPLFIIQTGQAAVNNAKLDVIIRNDAGTALINHRVSTNVVFDDTWHHIAWVDNHGSVQLYVDGELDPADFNYTPAGVFTMHTTAIGTLARAAVSTAAIFNGQMDEVAVWERPLSQAEVQEVMTNGVYTSGVPVPPRPMTLTSVPTDAVKNTGDWHLFSVTGYGNRPFTYQWSLNGSPIPGATDRTYQVTELTPSESGDFYSLAVTNPGGFAITTNATLTVLPDPAPDVENGLVNYWPLDVVLQEGANFISPEAHFGQSMVLQGFFPGSEIVSGQFSNALTFDFVNTYTYRTNGAPIYNSTNYSVSLWVRGDFTSQNDRRVFSEGRDGGFNNPLFTLGTDNAGTSPSATVFVRDDNGVNAAIVGRRSARPVFDGTWHHLVWTDANGQGKLYVDGVLDETDYNYTRGPLTLNQTSLGAVLRSTAGNYFFGDIDEVATWNRVLSWTEIQEVMTAGVPVPEGVTAPGIVTQPQDRTSNVYVGDDVTFSVLASGSEPLAYQWWKNGAAISEGLNPSAITSTLSLPNVQIADSNTTYSVVITNTAGAITSSVARLYVTPWAPVTSGEVLKLDVGLTGSATLDPIQPGFSALTFASGSVGSGVGTFDNAVRVTFTSVGGSTLQARDRIGSAVAPVVNNPPLLTQAQIYNDFVFNNNNTAGTGLRVLIDRLSPNTPYGLTVWSYDAGSAGATFGRVSEWSEISSGVPLVITNGYAFNGGAATLPARNYQYTFGGVFTSSASGALEIEGLRAADSDGVAVFVNAIRLVANPVGTQITQTERIGDVIGITVVSDYPGQPVFIHQSPALDSGNWTDTGLAPVETSSVLSVFEIPVGDGTMFFRPVSYPTW
jgi:hypothetical protein